MRIPRDCSDETVTKDKWNARAYSHEVNHKFAAYSPGAFSQDIASNFTLEKDFTKQQLPMAPSWKASTKDCFISASILNILHVPQPLQLRLMALLAQTMAVVVYTKAFLRW